MIAGLDFDGTVADTNTEKVRWIKTHLGRDIEPWMCNRSECVPVIGEENYRLMGNHVYEEESTLVAAPVLGVERALHVLSRQAQLYVLSDRPDSRLVYAQAWLRQRDLLHYFKGTLSCTGKSKQDICHQLGITVLIDDDERHLRNVGSEGLRRILLQHGRVNRPELPPSVEFCQSWARVLDCLVPPMH